MEGREGLFIASLRISDLDNEGGIEPGHSELLPLSPRTVESGLTAVPNPFQILQTFRFNKFIIPFKLLLADNV